MAAKSRVISVSSFLGSALRVMGTFIFWRVELRELLYGKGLSFFYSDDLIYLLRHVLHKLVLQSYGYFRSCSLLFLYFRLYPFYFALRLILSHFNKPIKYASSTNNPQLLLSTHNFPRKHNSLFASELKKPRTI